MANTITVSLEPKGETDYTINTLAAGRQKIVQGWLGMAASGSTAGLVVSIPIENLVGVIIEPASGIVFMFNHSTKAVVPYYTAANASASTAASLGVVASSTDLSGLASVPFLAWGYD